MEKEALAHINLTKFEDSSMIGAEGSARYLIHLIVMLVCKLAK